MGKILLFFLALGCWIAYVMHGKDAPIPDTPTPTTSSNVSHHTSVNDMSPEEFKTWLAKQDPHDPEPKVVDNVEHYDAATLADLTATMNGSGSSTSTSATQALNSGDVVFTGTSSDSAGGAVDTSTTAVAVATGVAPAGYHLVRAHYTKKGHLVKAHLVHNRTSKKKTTVVKTSTSVSTASISQPKQAQDRLNYSRQTFPGQKINTSDPTVILGTGY